MVRLVLIIGIYSGTDTMISINPPLRPGSSLTASPGQFHRKYLNWGNQFSSLDIPLPQNGYLGSRCAEMNQMFSVEAV